MLPEPGSDSVCIVICDHGKGSVQVKYTASVKIQQNPMDSPGAILGNYKIKCTYTVGANEAGEYAIQKLDVEKPIFQWNKEAVRFKPPKKFESVNLQEVYHKHTAT